MLVFIIAGLTTGSIYGLAAVGLVLTYKTSGILNFGHGALATVSAYLFYTLHVSHDMPWPLAAIICVLVVGPVLGLVFERIARSLAPAGLATQVVSTVGVLLIVQASVTIIYGTFEVRTVPQFLPTKSFTIDGTTVSMTNIIIFAVGVIATAVLYLFFRFARLGVAMRALVDNTELLDLAGTNPTSVRRMSWIIGVVFASASGILLISVPPPQSLDPINLTFVVVAAFGAAAIGAFSSLPGTYLGGLGIGVAASLCTKYFTDGILAGVSVSLPFIVLFFILLVMPRRRLLSRTVSLPRTTSTWTAPWRVQVGAAVPALVVLLFVPSFAGLHLQDYSRGLALTVLFLSLGLLARTSGQVSLAHVSFMAIGVCAFAHLISHGWPWGVALVVSGLIAMPIGAVLAIPAIRLSGIYLALATLGFGILLQFMFYTEDYMFGSNGIGLIIPRPKLSFLSIDSDNGYYYLVLAIAFVCVALLIVINYSRLGRLLRALADSPVALATSGSNVRVTRVLVFCVSAFLAAIAGVLEAASLAVGGAATVNGAAYQPITSLVYFVLIVIAVGGIPWYALVAAFGVTLIPSYFPGNNTSNYLTLVFGIFAVLYSLTPPQLTGTPPALQHLLGRLGRARRAPDAEPEGPRGDRRAQVASGGLKVDGLRVSFGGLVAVDGVTIEAPTGRITGLIGPNGAGKTTTFNACSGLIRPGAGHIAVDSHDVSHFGPPRRAREGLGRTFQQMELYDSMTVAQNVALGAEAEYAGLNALGHLVSTPAQRKHIRQATAEALAYTELTEHATKTVAALSTGQRRLVELARCLAGSSHLLLLDEPSSGLDRAETARFGDLLTRVVADRGVGVLIVEHDMTLVTAICDYIYVLDFGKPIFEGTASEVVRSPIVQLAYLGTGDLDSEELAEDDSVLSTSEVIA